MNELQSSILSVAKRLDEICKKNDIPYFIMGGTALGAVRHGGFIPWDDDIDVFMTPESFDRFRAAVKEEEDGEYFVDLVGLSDNFVEYAKFRKKNTTFIERVYIDKDVKHNVFVDIMLLRKLPDLKLAKKIYRMSQLVSFLTISETEWKPKRAFHKICKSLSRVLPRKRIANYLLKRLDRYEREEGFEHYCYFMSRVKLEQGIFPKSIFENSVDIKFENTTLSAPKDIRKYLSIRYGNYMKLPPVESREGEHAFFYDTSKDYTSYIEDFRAKYAVISLRREQSADTMELFAENGIKIDKGVYPSGGEITHIGDVKLPACAVYLRGSADIGEVVRLLRKLKSGEMCVFDIDGELSQKSVQRLLQAVEKYSVRVEDMASLKKRLHGKIK